MTTLLKTMKEHQTKLLQLRAQLSRLEGQSKEDKERLAALDKFSSELSPEQITERSELQQRESETSRAIWDAEYEAERETSRIEQTAKQLPEWLQAEWSEEAHEEDRAAFVTVNTRFEQEAQIYHPLQSRAEVSIPRRDLTTVRDLDAAEWDELFLFVEQILVRDFGIFLPRNWFTSVGVATECLTLLAEFIAIRKAQAPLTGWFSHLDAFSRRLGVPWTDPPFEESVGRGEPYQRRLALYAPGFSGLEPERRARRWRFRAWLVSDNRPRSLDLSFPAIETFVKECTAQQPSPSKKSEVADSGSEPRRTDN
ncbi:MAG: hypothetical protein ACYCU8_16115 [Ferrimicrobium acidiphilum]